MGFTIVRYGVAWGTAQIIDKKTLPLLREMMQSEPVFRGDPKEAFGNRRDLQISGMCAAALLELGSYSDQAIAFRRILIDDAIEFIAYGLYKALRFIDRSHRQTKEISNAFYRVYLGGDKQEKERCIRYSWCVQPDWLGDHCFKGIFYKYGATYDNSIKLTRELAKMDDSLIYKELLASLPKELKKIKAPLGINSRDMYYFLIVTNHEYDIQFFDDIFTENAVFVIVESILDGLTKLKDRSWHGVLTDDMLYSGSLDGSLNDN